MAFVCSYDGMIQDVIWDDFAFEDYLVGLSHFVSIFDSSSVQKGLALFLQVKEHGVALGWEINVRVSGEPKPMCFAAAALGDRIVILASATWQGSDGIYDGMSRVINDQVNSLRTLNKNAGLGIATPPTSSGLPDKFAGEIIGDMLELNNRLVNAERELARKNAELRRLSAVLSKDLYLAHRVLQCSGEAVVIANRDHRIVDVNHAFTAITGFAKKDVLGAPVRLIESGPGALSLEDNVWESVRLQGLWQGECASRRKSGELFPKWLTVSSVLDDGGNTGHYVVIFSDISRLKDAEEKWQHLAFFDSLTNLPNRVLFNDRLEQSIAKVRRENKPLALLFIDLDDFKLVNDSLGHDAGDLLLCEVARRLRECIRESDTLCRYGGDEFIVVLSGCEDELDVVQVCDNIMASLNVPVKVREHALKIGVSIGISRFPDDSESIDLLIGNADAAMYAAKAAGRNTYRFFSSAMGNKISAQLNLKTHLAQGLHREEFELHFQPEVELATGHVKSIEALLRWRRPEYGLVMPDAFISVAESSGLIVKLGEFVIRESIRRVRQLRDLGWRDLKVAINVSGRQLAVPKLASYILGRLRDADVPGEALIVEITESMVMNHMDQATRVLRELKEFGIQVAIDDFGTGYSSLSHLRRLPADFLKIDKSFVADADVADDSRTIISAIAAMSTSLGLTTIAEGIERPTQQALLNGLGCAMGQGRLYSEPLPFESLVAYLEERQRKGGISIN